MQKKRIYYFDTSKKGIDLMSTGDIPMLTNEQAIKESIYNLMFTQPKSRVMNPYYGVDIDRYLFEPLDSITVMLMKHDIDYGLETFETRITDINTVIETDEINQQFNITINYNIVFSNSPQAMKVVLKKIR